MEQLAGLSIVPVTAARLGDLAAVMASCGNAARCWCAYWYLSNATFKAGWGEANRAPLEQLVRDGQEPGLLAYVNDGPAAWVSVTPRGNLDRLNRSASFARLDAKDVWAVSCFVVAKPFRRLGMTAKLAAAAADFALDRGADGVEAYPLEPGPRTRSGDLYLGTPRTFEAAGYREVARPLPRRPIMRRMS